MKRGFGSDNHAGVHPEIIKAILEANKDHAVAYGEDEYSEAAVSKFKEHFGENIDVYFVFNGTAANVLGITAVTNPFNAIICAKTAHLNLDECGAPERFSGCKLLTIPTNNGKITVDQIEQFIDGVKDVHRSQPKVISITQATEYGTVYKVKEIKEISRFAKDNNLILHMDGARISNAAVSLGVSLREVTCDAGVDVLSFGGTKNGMMFGEAVILFDKGLSSDLGFIRKQGMQLSSKMRFIAAQFSAILSNDLWNNNASHSNTMAKYLETKLKSIPQVKITQPVESNAVYTILPDKYIPLLQKEYNFHVRDMSGPPEARLMPSFDTTKDDIDGFINLLQKLINSDE
ncbi:threonine aldolase family protein [candidate division KSB1 bacterium]